MTKACMTYLYNATSSKQGIGLRTETYFFYYSRKIKIIYPKVTTVHMIFPVLLAPVRVLLIEYNYSKPENIPK